MSTDFSSRVGLINIEGLISGLNITDILNRIADVRRRPIQVLQQHQQRLQDTLSLYQTLEARVVSLQTAVQTLATASIFQSRNATSSDQTAVAVFADPGAAIGSYSITVNQLAQAHKVASASFTAANQALGLQGDILINGRTVHIEADDDLLSIASAINSAGASVQAAVVQVSQSDYRLLLTSLSTGRQSAIDLVDANAASVLVSLGLVQSSASIKHPITSGAASDPLDSPQTAVGSLLQLTSPPAGTIQINGVDVSIDLSTDSLQDIAARINAAVPDVTATVLAATENGRVRYRLEVVGSSETPTFADSNNILATLGILTKAPANEIQAPQDAEILLDGIPVSRSTNTIDDALPGLRLQLLKANPSSPVTVTVRHDVEPAVQAVQSFISAYNAVVDFIRQNQSYDSETGQGGAFMSNFDVVTLENELRRALSYPIRGFSSGDTLLLSQIGITTDHQDHLVLDQTSLRNALTADPQLFARYFATTGWASNTAVQYIGSSPTSRPSPDGGYVVQITQPATKARAESASFSSGITQDETLTFYDRYTVQLFAGMTLDEAVAALNQMFTQNRLALTAAVDGDKIVIEHQLYGSRARIQIASSLDRGAGGTDLGGATAGEAAVYAGTDVAGTIGGEPATGSGQYLTGNKDNPNTAGLCIKVTASAPGNYGAVFLAKGAAQRLLDVLAAVENPATGMFARASENINNQISRLQEDINTMESRLQSYLDDLRQEFLAMEEALGQAQALSQYISNQLIGIQRLTSGSWR
ncbi:MAG: flagellar filament capping protein FliD [Armatimonadetes bacterium]|nr:flagellar filament capping protein FliD [Armatimonadota bacterium]